MNVNQLFTRTTPVKSSFPVREGGMLFQTEDGTVGRVRERVEWSEPGRVLLDSGAGRVLLKNPATGEFESRELESGRLTGKARPDFDVRRTFVGPDGTCYFQGVDEPGEEHRLEARDRETLALKWCQEAPYLLRDHVFSPDGKLWLDECREHGGSLVHVIEPDSGKELARHKLGGVNPVVFALGPEGTVYALIHYGAGVIRTLLGQRSSTLVAFDPATNQRKWLRRVKPESNCLGVQGNRLYLQPYAQDFTLVLDAATGRELGRAPRSVNGGSGEFRKLFPGPDNTLLACTRGRISAFDCGSAPTDLPTAWESCQLGYRVNEKGEAELFRPLATVEMETAPGEISPGPTALAEREDRVILGGVQLAKKQAEVSSETGGT